MNGGPRIIPIDAGQPHDGTPGTASAAEAEALVLTDEALSVGDDGTDWESDAPARVPSGVIAPLLALLLVAAWSAFFGWANREAMLAGATPAQWSQWIVAWAVPVLLVLVGYLVLLRTSRREAARFGDAARALVSESERLASRLAATNTELSLARDFIAAQGRDLDSLGRIAVDRIGASAGRLQELIQGNGAQVDRIAEISTHALDNMEKLRGQLPVITNAAKDVTNTIAMAGRTAHSQLEDLIAGFQRLNEFGTASERQVNSIRERVDATLAAFGEASERIAGVAGDRLAAIGSETEAMRAQLDREEIAALAAIRARADALGRELEQQRAAVAAAEDEALVALRGRTATMAEELAQARGAATEAEELALAALRQRAEALTQELVRQGQVVAAAEEETLAALHTRFEQVRADTSGQVGTLRRAIEEIGRDHDGLLAESRQRLAEFEASARALVESISADSAAIDQTVAQRRASMEAAMRAQHEAISGNLERLESEIARRRDAMAAAGAEATDALSRQLAAFDAALEAQRQKQADEAESIAERCEAIGARVAAFSATLDASGDQGRATAEAVDAGIGALNRRLVDMRETLAGTDREVASLTDAAVRLLELVQAGSDHTRTQMPEALRSTEAGLDRIEDRVVALRDTLREAGESGRGLSESVVSARADLVGTLGEIARLHDEFAAHASAQEARLAALRAELGSAREDSEALGREIEGRLSGALARLAEAAGKAGAELRDSSGAEIEALAARLGEDASAAIARVLQGRGAELVARLEEAIDSAAAASRETAIQMRDQLAKVDELAGNLENRVERARERAEEQVDNDFARRTALITESLNSTAIDIAKVLSTDVSETAWASYLRGDRGIFTRRAVSLLDSAEARLVQQHYEGNTEFREHVNRYIHDFEAMLRQLLSTRDGNALGVTLLSSDMGKLYVALAQGIERLRT